jgi:hypothetical protein
MFNERTPIQGSYPLRPATVPFQTQSSYPPVGATLGDTPGNRTKSYLLQKVQALLPFLSEILRQNDAKASGIVNRMTGLRDNLDGIF